MIDLDHSPSSTTFIPAKSPSPNTLMATTLLYYDARNMSTGHAASIFPGDKVRLDGLVSSSQYNGLRGMDRE
jgi:hypothetical protein